MNSQPGPALPIPQTFQGLQVATCTPKPGGDLAKARTQGPLGGSLGFAQGLAGCWGVVAEAEVRAAPRLMGPAQCPEVAPGA